MPATSSLPSATNWKKERTTMHHHNNETSSIIHTVNNSALPAGTISNRAHRTTSCFPSTSHHHSWSGPVNVLKDHTAQDNDSPRYDNTPSISRDYSIINVEPTGIGSTTFTRVNTNPWLSRCISLGQMYKLLLFIVGCIILLEVLIFRFQFTYAPIDLRNRSRYHNILLVADPQLTDRLSYSFVNNEYSPLSRFIFMLCDTFMRKNFQSILRMNKDNIHTIIFMGDLFDNGRTVTDDEYEREFKRFNAIFENSQNIKTLYLSGNHDIGLNSWGFEVMNRFKDHFKTELNFNYTINNYFNIIGVNSMYLYDERRSPWNFLEMQTKLPDRNILLTHIPLWRNGPCEAVDKNLVFEKSRTRPLKDGFGHGYRNLLDSGSSERMLKLTHPLVVLSGDDHEYCKYRHTLRDEDFGVYEHTLPTFSMLQGTTKYGYGILSLDLPSNNVMGLAIHNMPKIYNIFIFYGMLSLSTSIYIIFKTRSAFVFFSILGISLTTFALCQVWWWLI